VFGADVGARTYPNRWSDAQDVHGEEHTSQDKVKRRWGSGATSGFAVSTCSLCFCSTG
jgi:hypothetical protein